MAVATTSYRPVHLAVDNTVTTAMGNLNKFDHPMVAVAAEHDAQIEAQGRGKEASMTDHVSREELQAELRALRSESEARFERIVSEVRVANTEVTAAISNLRTELAGEYATLRSGMAGEYSTLAAQMKGENEVTRARMAGKFTVWGAAASSVVAVLGVLFVLFQIAQAAYDTGGTTQTAINEQGTKLSERMNLLEKDQAELRRKVEPTPRPK